MPGAARYQETLERYTNQAIAGELQPQEAMDQCATEFNAITDELGRDSQVGVPRPPRHDLLALAALDRGAGRNDPDRPRIQFE